LGISRWQWLRSSDANQLPAAASGLRLCSRDLLKLGLLYNNRGAWKGKQIVPARWVDSASRSSIERSGPGGSGGYGYQFWIFPVMTKQGLVEVTSGVGNGDQRVFIDPKHDLVVVITAGNYNNWALKKNANALLGEIYTALSAASMHRHQASLSTGTSLSSSKRENFF
jgi:CubicO group peptidase (beta-lactamase class C family)